MNEDIKQPVTRSTPATRKAQVLNDLGEKKLVTQVTTEEYVKNIEKPANENLSAFANPFTGSSYALPDTQLNETPLMRVLRELKDYDDDTETEFVAMVTRRQDSMNDNFKRKCLSDEQFLPLYFYVKDVINFPSILFRANKDSGGKFLLIITDNTGNYITRYFVTVPNDLLPPEQKDEKVNILNSNNDIVTIVRSLIDNQNQQTEKILATITAQNRPQEKSTLEKAMEAKLLRELTEEKPPVSNDANFMRDIYKNEMFQLKMIGEMFKETNTPETPPLGFLEKMLNNEQFVTSAVDKVGLLASNIVQLIAMKSMQANNPQTVSQTVHNPHPQEVTQQPELTEAVKDESIMKQQAMFNEITTELERLDAEKLPVTLDNPVLIKLSSEYSDIYPMIINFAKMSEFNTVWDILTEQILSDELKDKYLDEQGDLTEQGVKVKGKVKELYELWKSS